MTTITIEEAQAKLPELIGEVAKGEEVAIVQGDRVVARLVGEPPALRHRLPPGFAKDNLRIVAEDDEHLDGFAESML